MSQLYSHRSKPDQVAVDEMIARQFCVKGINKMVAKFKVAIVFCFSDVFFLPWVEISFARQPPWLSFCLRPVNVGTQKSCS